MKQYKPFLRVMYAEMYKIENTRKDKKQVCPI